MTVEDVSFLDFGLLETKLPVAHPEAIMAQMIKNNNFFIFLDFVDNWLCNVDAKITKGYNSFAEKHKILKNFFTRFRKILKMLQVTLLPFL